MSGKRGRKKYYAYFIPQSGRGGVTEDWQECEFKVKGVTGARFKAFEAMSDAESWLRGGARYEIKKAPKLEPGIYFDAGTGRGEGVEISVTDESGKNLLHKAISRDELNRFGKQLLADASFTNNYGELLALRYAITVAIKEGVKHIFGDSKLVIEYWSRWRIKRKELPEETALLADEVSEMREEFEKKGGSITRISGDHNPADLGFHR